MRKILLSLILMVTMLALKAQNCTQRLNAAEDDYEAGRLLGIPDLIKGCLVKDRDEGFSREEEIRARKLLTLVYIFTDNDAMAEESLISLLKADPEHQLDPQVDPAELFFLYNQFRVKPIFRVAFKLSVNASFPSVVGNARYSTAHTGNYPPFYNGRTPSGETQYSRGGDNFPGTEGIGLGTCFELMAERHLINGIEVGFGPQLRVSSYHMEGYLNDISISTKLSHRQVYLRLPLLVRYNFNYSNYIKTRFIPYIYAGGGPDFLLAANYSEASRIGGTSFALPQNNDLKASGQVEPFNFSAFAGAGVKVKIATHFLTVEARYDNSFLNYINSDERWVNQSSTFDLGLVEDDLVLDYVSFSVGWTHSMYSPKKLKIYR